jgi:hypothetical protein
MISWNEIENHVKNGQDLLYEGLSGKYLLNGIEIYPSVRDWPSNLIFESYKIQNREIFGILRLTFK